MHLDDTIVALASASGPGARGIIRLSGPQAHEIVQTISTVPLSNKRSVTATALTLPGFHSPLPADIYFAPGPHSYTGQDTAEIHTISSPPLLDTCIAALMDAGGRAAQAGEFTLRAFLGGKRDLTQAEAVLAVIEAGSDTELQQALGQLAGGVTTPLRGLREDLLNLLADVEAGLDFTEEDLQFVDKKDVLLRVGKGLAQLLNLKRQLDERSVNSQAFRVAFVGPPNAGKSSLFNTLLGESAAIVSPQAGTTRDYLTRRLSIDNVTIELLDTAGLRDDADSIETEAQSLGSQQSQQADLIIWCRSWEMEETWLPSHIVARSILTVITKIDLAPHHEEFIQESTSIIATSVEMGTGIHRLRSHLIEKAKAHLRPAIAPSLSRCRHHVESCLEHLRKAHQLVLFDEPAEILALELRATLDDLGEMVGAVYTDDLLGRIFSRFCIGK